MDLTSFLIRIIFLVLPGIITSLLYRKFLGKKSARDLEDALEIVLFSVLSYSLYGLGVKTLDRLGWYSATFTSFEAFSDEKIPIRWQEILVASAIGLLLAFIASAFYTHKVIHRIGRHLKVTRRFGDEDVWDFFHNSPDIVGQWVHVRDHKMGVTYFAWINTFSESEKERELVLRDVEVYRNSLINTLSCYDSPYGE